MGQVIAVWREIIERWKHRRRRRRAIEGLFDALEQERNALIEMQRKLEAIHRETESRHD